MRSRCSSVRRCVPLLVARYLRADIRNDNREDRADKGRYRRHPAGFVPDHLREITGRVCRLAAERVKHHSSQQARCQEDGHAPDAGDLVTGLPLKKRCNKWKIRPARRRLSAPAGRYASAQTE
jgi:hypothetical protein